ncbi:MAG: MFS transporter [Chloroflexi bacterium]|nr:MFS transporter [Chloroflexota bacterium]
MAAAGAVSMAMGSLNYGLFIKPMGDELGIGRSTFGWAQTARQVASSATSPFVGRLLDRFGSRVMLPVAAIVTGSAMIGLAMMNYSWQLVMLFAIMGLVGMSGPGALVTSVPVLKWFVRNRGKAISFMALGVPIGAIIFVPLTQVFIDAWGWRQTWFVLAIIGVGVIVPLAVIFVRRQPEDMGLLPDGAASPAELAARGVATQPRLVEEASWSTSEAMRSATLWRLVAVFSIVSLAIGTMAVHRIAAFMDRGLDPRLISFATAFDAVCAGASTFALGLLVRRLSARSLGSAGFVLLAAASVLTIYATTIPVMFASMALFGVGIGGMIFLQNFIWADYFGRRNVGSIRGLVTPVNLVIGGIGAPLAGYVRDATGSYDIVWWAGVALMLFAAALFATTSAPKRPSALHSTAASE